MDVSRWEQLTLRALHSEREDNPSIAVVHYQLALAESQQLTPMKGTRDELEELLTIKVMSCHNLANFWRNQGDDEFELKYLQLASEQVMAMVPQCPRRNCESFIASLGCCKSALIEFLKRHPNPIVARQVENINVSNQCELIARFRLH
ncbi:MULTISPECIES: DUF2753 family protein [Photobacterium]|uniref:Membrane protein n=1 Tax=Photobacterium ganghwense TaxID=320778 RepID=A0A0J1K0D2_9GAMM|nr:MULTISPECIES: DUF2753 family protein [Photobacterium]KLV07927.1 membrane protein [Photobacterium ganghwense]MBV1843219.1 DUF2753 domain-containing protein [Photobacterium ganghwense]PSU07029.1 DUF2753 domain-containing protein [Photobacterium ganghwense]QSV15783.1 DUF2753 family protein [Photobacterium ganghwense]